MKLTREQLITPALSPEAIKSLFGLANQHLSKQGAAANLTDVIFVAEFDGEIDEIIATCGTLSAAGESMTVDVQKNGVSILTSTTAFTAAGASGKVVPIALDPDKKSFVKGDVFSVVRAYTAGGGPTPMKDTLVIVRPTIQG